MSALPDWFWYFIAWVPYTAITIFYGLAAPWYRSAIGRSLFLSKLSVCLLLSFVLSIFVLGQYPGLYGVRSILLTCLAVAGTYQFSAFVRIWRTRRRMPPCPRRRATDL